MNRNIASIGANTIEDAEKKSVNNEPENLLLNNLIDRSPASLSYITYPILVTQIKIYVSI